MGWHWKIRPARHCGGFRSVGYTVYLYVEDEIFEGRASRSALLVVGHECGDIQRTLAALFEFSQSIVPAWNDLTHADDEL